MHTQLLRPRLLIASVALLLAAGGLQAGSDKDRRAFSEMKQYDESGRPWRVATEDWIGARQRVAADPEWRAWLASEQQTVDAWINRHHDRVTWIAGWSNDFVSPKDGSRLTWTQDIPGEEADHFFSPSDPKVEITDKLMAAWVRLWREQHAQMMERAARLYRLTGDERYAEWSAGQLDFYSKHYLEWEPQRQGARLFWQSLTEGVNLITYAHVVRLLDGYVDTARRSFWFDRFFAPEVEVLNANFPMILNITCWLRAASAQVGLIFDQEEMWQEAINGRFGVREQVAEGITDDYLWFEQSLNYNAYVVEALHSLFVTAGLYGRADELNAEMCRVQNLMLAPVYLRFPDGSLPNPSDTKGILRAPDRDLFASAYRVFPSDIGQQENAGRKTWDTLLDPPSGPLTRGGGDALPQVTSRNLESSRMAVLRQGPWQVFLHYGQPPIKSHLQAEVLNFSASFRGTDVTHDPGTVGYGSPLHRDYFLTGLNHNVPLVDGEGQEQPPKGNRPDPFQFTRAGELRHFSANRVSAYHPVYRSNAAAGRSLEIIDDRLRDIVELKTNDAKTHALGLVLHVQGTVELPAKFVSDPTFAKGRSKAFGYWTGVRGAEYVDEATFVVRLGSEALRVTFAVPGPFRVWHGSSPDVPPDRREAFYLEMTGAETTFTTTFEPVD